MSINEYDEDRSESEEEEKFPSTRIEKISKDSIQEEEEMPKAKSGTHSASHIGSSSELSVLKHKLLEMKEKYQSDYLNVYKSSES